MYDLDSELGFPLVPLFVSSDELPLLAGRFPLCLLFDDVAATKDSLKMQIQMITFINPNFVKKFSEIIGDIIFWNSRIFPEVLELTCLVSLIRFTGKINAKINSRWGAYAFIFLLFSTTQKFIIHFQFPFCAVKKYLQIKYLFVILYFPIFMELKAQTMELQAHKQAQTICVSHQANSLF